MEMLLRFGWVKRGRQKNMLFKLITLLIISTTLTIATADEMPTRVGYAYDKNTDDFIYTETHYEKFSGKTVAKSRVVYKDTSEEIFAEKNVDFSVNKFLPEFKLKNKVTGHMESTRFIENKYQVAFIKSEKEPKKEVAIDTPNDGISDSGYDNFIIKHWDEIKEGEVFVRGFLIPSLTKFIKFRIYQEEVIDDEHGSLRVINVEPNSFLLRAFAGTSKLYYDKAKPRLRKYDGVSNLRDSKGENLQVMIRYEDTNNLALN